nr:splicing factor 3B subunit 4-like [Cherax quadricarinatus]
MWKSSLLPPPRHLGQTSRHCISLLDEKHILQQQQQHLQKQQAQPSQQQQQQVHLQQQSHQVLQRNQDYEKQHAPDNTKIYSPTALIHSQPKPMSAEERRKFEVTNSDNIKIIITQFCNLY